MPITHLGIAAFLPLLLYHPLLVPRTAASIIPDDAFVQFPLGHRFTSWYPQYRVAIETVLATHCSEPYAQFQADNGNDTTCPPPLDLASGADPHSHMIQPLVQCLLEHISEYVKVSFAASQVLLGVTPTILAILGPSVEEGAMLCVVGRRPFLALLLGMASPSVYFNRAFEVTSLGGLLRGCKISKEDTVVILTLGVKTDPTRLGLALPKSRTARGLVVVAEYAFAVFAVANVALQTYELGMQTFCSIWPNSMMAPMAWAGLRLLLHILGLLLVRMRLRRRGGNSGDGDDEDHSKNGPSGLWARAREAWRLEWSLCCTQGSVSIKELVETRWFMLLAWLIQMLTVVHVMYGTVVLSSLIFIGARDAVLVLGRLMISLLCCRVILMYEMAGLRSAYLQGRQKREGVLPVVTGD